MYCSLQEAYQIPVFATRRKKGSSASTPGSVPTASDPDMDTMAPAFRKYNQEDFADNSSLKDKTGSPIVDSVAYTAGQASDYKYYESYGLKYPKISTEGFQDIESCPSKDTMYRIPVSDAAKKQYDAAMKVAIDSGQKPSSTPLVLGKQTAADMNHVSGYYDEDLEQYLKVSDMKAAPMPRTVTPSVELKAEPYDPKSSPFAESLSKFEGQMRPPEFRSESKMGTGTLSAIPWQDGLMDILLFIICGLLVIFLCDQLYRIAALIGMKDTIELVRPFLELPKT
jgi:hypothetical protein